MGKKMEIGQTVYFRIRDYYGKHIRIDKHPIAKVGRKWFEIKGGHYQYDIETGLRKGSEHWPPDAAYFTK